MTEDNDHKKDANTTATKPANNNESPPNAGDFSELGGFFRGIAVAARVKLPVLKVASAKVVRQIGSNRPLAFASEGAVAGNALMPRWLYYGAWGLSGLAISADIASKTWDAPEHLKPQTASYWTLFHVPASLVVPAWIIHRVVHAAEQSMERHAKTIPQRVRPYVPVGAALLSIVPVVPTVDYLAEVLLEPTLGAYLGLTFDHHHHHNDETETKVAPIVVEKSKEKKE